MQTTTLETTLVEQLIAQRDATKENLARVDATIAQAKADILSAKPKAARTLSEATAERSVLVEHQTDLTRQIGAAQSRIVDQRNRAIQSAKFDELAEIARAANVARGRYDAEFAAVGDALNTGIERLVDAALAFHAERRRFVDEARELAPEIGRAEFSPLYEADERQLRSQLVEIRKQLEARQADVGAVASVSFVATRAETTYLNRAWCDAANQRCTPPVKHRETILSLAKEVLARRRRETARHMN